MAAITRPNYVRAALGSDLSYSDSESATTALELDGEAISGPLGLFEVRVKKVSGGADNTTIRLYAEDNQNILLFEQVYAFGGDNEWLAFQLPRDAVVRAGESPVITAESTSGSHSLALYASFNVAAVQ